MLFSSPIFFAFFLGYFVVHLMVPARFRLLLIILGGTIFYAYWRLAYFWVPYLLIVIAYFGAIWMDGAADAALRKQRFVLAIAVLLLPLAIFKYTDFIYADVAGAFLGLEGEVLGVPLPLGISFVTFTMIAYVADVFLGKFAVVRRFDVVAAYAIFFPHLIAGPILRPHELIPQITRSLNVFSARFGAGIAIFSIGLVKKLVFADQIAPYVDRVFAEPSAQSGLESLLGIYGYSMQIYCDFSGYTDMAIGAALIIGVRLPNNFARPYGATSIVDFWRRWHITLSMWLRDYLYIPLGGNRLGRWREAINIVITMVLGGLWHGANWTFVIWGAVHGIAVAATHAARRAGIGAKVPRWLAVFLTFHLVTIAWIFFRSPDMATVWSVMSAPLTADFGNPAEFVAANAFPLVLLATFFTLHRLDDHRLVMLAVRRVPRAVVWPSVAFLWLLAISISTGSSDAFIYFDF